MIYFDLETTARGGKNGIHDRQWGDDESLAVSICEACCDALEDKL